jgi:TetR/AcrR family transcriptional regulator, transcriptional repressor for nem operon
MRRTQSGEPRTKPAGERRADLMAAGQALFVSKGIAATTLEEITDGAGVSKGLFYVYFRSKDDLVLALQDEFSVVFSERILAATATRDDFGEKLDACVDATFDAFRELNDLHEVLFRHSSHGLDHDQDHEPAHARLVRAIQGILEEGIEAGAFHVDDPETTAGLFYMTMHAFDLKAHGSNPPSDRRLVEATKQLFRRTAGVVEQGRES